MIKIAIDMGTSVTKIFRAGSGVVLSEPSCVAVNTETDQVKAIGGEAKRLLGKTAEFTKIIFPVYEGEIVDLRMATAMLDEFLNKVGLRASRRHIEVLFSVPCGITEKALSAIYSLCDELGIARLHFVEVPYLSAIGQDLPISDSNPAFVMDIGAGVTNIAVLSLDGIIAGMSVNIGGNNMDAHIIEYVAEKCGLRIGSQTSEKLKNTVASLLPGDNQSTLINGRDISSGHPRSVSVSSRDILIPVSSYVDKIVEYASMVFRKLPAEVSAGICKSGVRLSGGVCKIVGIGEYIRQKLGIETEVHVCDEPQMAVVLGGGRVVATPNTLKKIRLPY